MFSQENPSNRKGRRVSRNVLSIQEPEFENQAPQNLFDISRVEQTPNKNNLKKLKNQSRNKLQSSQQILINPKYQKKKQQKGSTQNIQTNKNRQHTENRQLKQNYDFNLQDDEHQVYGVQQKNWLSLSESINLTLGHFNYQYNFPIKREIPIIANNLDLERQKYENGTYISQSFDNNLSVSFSLFFIRTIFVENFFRLSIVLWILAIILGFVVSGNEQYRPGKEIILAIFLFYCVLATIFSYLGLKNRRGWQQPASSIKYKVYHYDNQSRLAEWIPTDATDLRPGNIYIIPSATTSNPSIIPADSILLNGPRTIVQIDQSPIIEYLSPTQKQQNISLKQILLKSKSIKLPFTGAIHYQLAAPQILEQNIYGKFILLQPSQQSYDVSYSNVILRGSKLLSSEIFFKDQYQQKNQKNQQYYAMVLETGIDSLVLKTSQYPFLFRKNYTYNKIIDLVLITCSILYLLVVGSGILIGYIYLNGKSITRGFYIQNYLNLGEQPTKLSIIVLNHFANLIMIIPILLRVVYLIFVYASGLRFNQHLNVQLKDANMLSQASQTDLLVTTIGSDLAKIGDQPLVQNQEKKKRGENQLIKPPVRNRNLQSIRVGKIHHNFETTSIENEMYKQNDVHLIRFFMSTSLLTCNLNKPTPLQRAIMQRCNQLKLKVEKTANAINIQNILKVSKIFTIPSTQRYPFKIQFFRDADNIIKDYEQEKANPKQKVLVIVRGQTTKIISGLSESQKGVLRQFSNKLHQEKGFHIELIGRFSIQMDQFKQLKKVYANNQKERAVNATDNKDGSLGIVKFYADFDRHLKKVDAMGLLIWENPYNVLTDNSLPISSLNQIDYKIIIAPPSKSILNPQFESIHAITNYLLKAQKLPLKQISNKILHHYTDKETIWALLQAEKIIVINGWDYRVIKKMLSELKQIRMPNRQPIKMLGYIQQDQYAWVLKETDVSIATKGDGNDLQKYADILIQKNRSETTTKTIRNILQYSKSYSYGMSGIIIIQFMKGVILATIEFINLFYTWGTGLIIIASPLYLLLEIGLLFDIFYYIFPRVNDSSETILKSNKQELKQKNNKTNRKLKNEKTYLTLQYMIKQLILSLLIGTFLTLIPIYSFTQAIAKNGVLQPKQFTHFTIHFILYHSLIFRKLFMKPFALSIYKLFIIAIQIGIYYLGIVIISAADYNAYKGIIWYALNGKLVLVAIFMVWMITGVFWVFFMLETMVQEKLKPIKNKYQKLEPQQQKREDQSIIEKQKTKQQPIEID